MANGTQEDTSFLDKYRAQAPPPDAEDISFLEKYRAKSTATRLRPPPTMGAEATGIGPRKTGIYAAGTGAGPIESRVEDFLNPTTMYKKEHPILGGIGEGLRNLRETFTPGVMAAATLLGGPGGLEGEAAPSTPRRPSVPAMSLPESQFPRVSAKPRPAAGLPQTVFDEPRQLGPVPQSERGPSPAAMKAPSPESPTMETAKPEVEPIQKKPLMERRLGQAGRKPTVEQIVNQATGAKPLERNVPLREQFKTPGEPTMEDPVKTKYPDPEIRQMVRINGERMYEAAKGNPATLKAINDLTRVDLRQALINSGEDMGQMTVSGSKFAGTGSINRHQAFDRLLDKGLSPAKILELAKPPTISSARMQ